jgi:hypothetical protein
MIPCTLSLGSIRYVKRARAPNLRRPASPRSWAAALLDRTLQTVMSTHGCDIAAKRSASDCRALSSGRNQDSRKAGRSNRNYRRPRSLVVVTTIRLYYDAAIAVALTTVVAIVIAQIAAVIVGSNTPNVTVGVIAFVLTGPILLFRLRRSWPKSAMHPRTHVRATRWARTER